LTNGERTSLLVLEARMVPFAAKDGSVGSGVSEWREHSEGRRTRQKWQTLRAAGEDGGNRVLY